MLKCLKCNTVFKTKLSIHAQNHGCPLCTGSKGEKEIKEYLEKVGLKYEPQYSVGDTRLRFDFYIEELNLAIEYDGEQHFKSVKHWGGVKALLLSRKNDKIKDTFCKKHKVTLIRIPYWEFDNINKILKEKL